MSLAAENQPPFKHFDHAPLPIHLWQRYLMIKLPSSIFGPPSGPSHVPPPLVSSTPTKKKQTFGHLRDVVTNRVIAYGKFQTVRHIGDNFQLVTVSPRCPMVWNFP